MLELALLSISIDFTAHFYWLLNREGKRDVRKKLIFRNYGIRWYIQKESRRFLSRSTWIYKPIPSFHKFSFCERFEPRGHFISRLSLIVRVNVVGLLLLTMTFRQPVRRVILRVKVSCITLVDVIKL